MDLGPLTKQLGRTVFSTTSPWKETVGYRALADGPTGERREIAAVVARQSIEADAITGRTPAHEFVVHVANDAELGVDRPRQGDMLDFLDGIEGERFAWEVVEFATADAGRWQLVVEKRGRFES